jgi:hypothetical protein
MVKHRVKLGYWALTDLMHGIGYDQQALKGLDCCKIPEVKRQCQQATLFAMRFIKEHPTRTCGSIPEPPRQCHGRESHDHGQAHGTSGPSMDDGERHESELTNWTARLAR